MNNAYQNKIRERGVTSHTLHSNGNKMKSESCVLIFFYLLEFTRLIANVNKCLLNNKCNWESCVYSYQDFDVPHTVERNQVEGSTLRSLLEN